MRECGVVIIGAGPAGISAALSLKDLPTAFRPDCRHGPRPMGCTFMGC
jgi:succinate dehydrogenase/fumarate reductase flavoprotein subunit